MLRKQAAEKHLWFFSGLPIFDHLLQGLARIQPADA
jgi:hypothetical protein